MHRSLLEDGEACVRADGARLASTPSARSPRTLRAAPSRREPHAVTSGLLHAAAAAPEGCSGSPTQRVIAAIDAGVPWVGACLTGGQACPRDPRDRSIASPSFACLPPRLAEGITGRESARFTEAFAIGGAPAVRAPSVANAAAAPAVVGVPRGVPAARVGRRAAVRSRAILTGTRVLAGYAAFVRTNAAIGEAREARVASVVGVAGATLGAGRAVVVARGAVRAGDREEQQRSEEKRTMHRGLLEDGESGARADGARLASTRSAHTPRTLRAEAAHPAPHAVTPGLLRAAAAAPEGRSGSPLQRAVAGGDADVPGGRACLTLPIAADAPRPPSHATAAPAVNTGPSARVAERFACCEPVIFLKALAERRSAATVRASATLADASAAAAVLGIARCVAASRVRRSASVRQRAVRARAGVVAGYAAFTVRANAAVGETREPRVASVVGVAGATLGARGAVVVARGAVRAGDREEQQRSEEGGTMHRGLLEDGESGVRADGARLASTRSAHAPRTLRAARARRAPRALTSGLLRAAAAAPEGRVVAPFQRAVARLDAYVPGGRAHSAFRETANAPRVPCELAATASNACTPARLAESVAGREAALLLKTLPEFRSAPAAGASSARAHASAPSAVVWVARGVAAARVGRRAAVWKRTILPGTRVLAGDAAFAVRTNASVRETREPRVAGGVGVARAALGPRRAVVAVRRAVRAGDREEQQRSEEGGTMHRGLLDDGRRQVEPTQKHGYGTTSWRAG
jgi:hypothetical protein